MKFRELGGKNTMIISVERNEVLDASRYIHYKGNSAEYYYRGIFFYDGMESGTDSIKRLDAAINSGSIPFEKLMGAFVIVIKQKDELILFTDSSNQRAVYFTKNYISDSFLDVISRGKEHTLSEEAVCEFITFGQCFFEKTLVSEISVSKTFSYYRIRNGQIEEGNKGIANIDGSVDNRDYVSLFKQIGTSIKNHKISLALTGGFDSRMIMTLMKDYAPIDTCISGDVVNDRDIVLSKIVAETAGLKHEVETISNPSISYQTILSMFKDIDGYPTNFSENEYRIYELLKRRKAKGYDVHITGDTGILHKDEFWIQDYPFYSKRNFSIKKYYKQRIEMIHVDNHLSKKYHLIQDHVRKEILKWMEANRRETNTTSYDWFPWNLKYGTGMKRLISSRSKIIDIYCPLLELKVVRYGYNLPRKYRKGALAMREAMTDVCPDVASIPTWTGVTASSKRRYLARDIFFRGLNYLKKAFRLVGRCVIKRTILTGNVLSWKYGEDFRNMECSKDAFEFAIKNNIVHKDTRFSQVSNSLLGKLVYIYLISCLCEGKTLSK